MDVDVPRRERSSGSSLLCTRIHCSRTSAPAHRRTGTLHRGTGKPHGRTGTPHRYIESTNCSDSLTVLIAAPLPSLPLQPQAERCQAIRDGRRSDADRIRPVAARYSGCCLPTVAANAAADAAERTMTVPARRSLLPLLLQLNRRTLRRRQLRVGYHDGINLFIVKNARIYTGSVKRGWCTFFSRGLIFL